MVEWPAGEQKYTLICRKNTKGYTPEAVRGGWQAVVMAQYQALPPVADIGRARDNFTDMATFRGTMLHSANNPPLYPGRGMGIGDDPKLKLMADVDPSDVSQGGVGDCWLLAGISALAEFDGAVHKLFRKTPNVALMPLSTPNQYTVTLFDLKTWTPTDVTVDERLCAAPSRPGLLGSTPSKDGELWACYLEKAVAAHCGGWDKIDGGQCTRAWAMLTGCKHQYSIKKSGGGWKCFGWYNPNEKRFEPMANSPHEGFQALWPMAWPAVGGGGDLSLELSDEELFERLCAWDDEDYILGAGTKGDCCSSDCCAIGPRWRLIAIELRADLRRIPAAPVRGERQQRHERHRRRSRLFDSRVCERRCGHWIRSPQDA